MARERLPRDMGPSLLRTEHAVRHDDNGEGTGGQEGRRGDRLDSDEREQRGEEIDRPDTGE